MLCTIPQKERKLLFQISNKILLNGSFSPPNYIMVHFNIYELILQQKKKVTSKTKFVARRTCFNRLTYFFTCICHVTIYGKRPM